MAGAGGSATLGTRHLAAMVTRVWLPDEPYPERPAGWGEHHAHPMSQGEALL